LSPSRGCVPTWWTPLSHPKNRVRARRSHLALGADPLCGGWLVMGIGRASRASRCWQWQYHTSEPRLGGGQQQSSSQQTSDSRVCAGRWAEHGASAAAWQTGTRVRPSECAAPCRTGSCDLFPSQPVFAGAVDPGPVHPNFTAGAGSSHDGCCGESLWGRDGVARHQPAAPRGAGVRDRRWDGIFQGMPPRDGWRGGGQQTLTIWGRIAARMDGDVNSCRVAGGPNPSVMSWTTRVCNVKQAR